MRILALLGLVSTAALCGTVCDYYRSNNRSLYEAMCSAGGSSARPLGGQSSILDSLGLSAANIPTAPTSYGGEVLYSFIKSAPSLTQTEFGLVKGFNRQGAGLSSGSGNTFYSNDLIRREYQTPSLENFEPYESPKSSYGVNLSYAFSIFRPWKSADFKLGATARYNKGTATWGGGGSLLFVTPYFSIGSGIVQSKILNDVPPINFISSLASLRVSIFEAEYNYLKSDDPFALGPVHIGTLSIKVHRFILTAATKMSRFRLHGDVRQNHFALQYLANQYFSLSYLDNYIPGARTLGLQVYL